MIRKAFTLIELLVVVAVIGLLVAILVPSLSTARESSRVSVCASNLRQCYLACRMYADAHRGIGPAINRPVSMVPNWALQVLAYGTNRANKGTNALLRGESVLVCPTIDRFYPDVMTRTYAMNTTGHAKPKGVAPTPTEDPDGFECKVTLASPDDCDDRYRAHINFDGVVRPADVILLLDSAWVPNEGVPQTKTMSVLDFRNPDHVPKRLGIFHRNMRTFNAISFDGSCRPYTTVKEQWKKPLP